MHSLPVFLRLSGRPVILLGDGEAAEAKRRLLLRAGARIVGEDEAAALAIVAIDDDDAALAACERLRARGVLINAVDRPAQCDVTLPAIVDRDPVLVAIGTGGASAGLAKALRQRIEALLPDDLGRLAEALYAAREAIRRLFPEPAERRRAIDAALDPGGPLDPFGDAADVAGWLDGAETSSDATIRITLRSADPDDLTLREARWIARADTLCHDPGIAAQIIDRARADAHRIVLPCPDEPRPGITVILNQSERGAP